MLITHDLAVWYRDTGRPPVRALGGVCFEIQRGEIVGVAGRSGSGKTTLGLAILSALPRGSTTHGTIQFMGRYMAPVFQEATGALNPFLPIGTQVIEALRARRRPGQTDTRAGRKKVALAALEGAGLAAGLFDAFPHELSGGQKQRALIAQAVVGEPDLLVADEPTASLDAAAQAPILDVLRDLQQRVGMAMLLISHSPDLLAGLADRVLKMENGSLRE